MARRYGSSDRPFLTSHWAQRRAPSAFGQDLLTQLQLRSNSGAKRRARAREGCTALPKIVSVRAWPDAWCSWRSAACNTCKHGGYSCAERARIAQTDCGIGAKRSPASRDHRMATHFLLRASADHAQGHCGVHGRPFWRPLSYPPIPRQHDGRWRSPGRPLAGQT